MSKGERIEEFVRAMDLQPGTYHPCYLAYFECFNRQDYYEAHDVLEHLWLGGAGENYAFFKGLIQLAGAFVHLKKQHQRPWHPKDATRMRPASRLFVLAAGNLSSYAPAHYGLDVHGLLDLCEDYRARITAADFLANPWDPAAPPVLHLAPALPA